MTPEQHDREEQWAAEYLRRIRNDEPLEIVPTFYSELGRTVEELNLQTASGTQWLETLNNLQRFNQEEMQWVGLPEWLAQQRGQVMKWQICDFLREHDVRIKDIVKAEEPSGFIRVSETSWRNNIGVILVREHEGGMDGDPEWALYDSQGHYLQGQFMMHHDAVDWYKKMDGSSQLSRAYYPSHQLHGGINYREVLLTLPPQASVRAKFRSDHFKENNVVAHIRFNERTDIDGKKVLFIEEIGSEWASRLRNRGGNKGQEVPDMPFKSSWPELAMKRLLRWGAEHHFDRIAWAMGKQMAHRYKALNGFDTVKWIRWKNSQDFEIYGYHRGRQWHGIKNVAPDQLPRVVGNNLAEKIFTAAKTNIWGEFSGLGIWSGNKGLSTFYDKTLPNTVNRYVAQWGIQVETGEIAVPNLTPWIPPGSVDERLVIEKYGEDVDYSKVSVWQIDITQAMRESVMQGQSLFLAFSGGNEHQGRNAAHRPNPLHTSGGMTPEQSERGKDIAEYLQKIRNCQPIKPRTIQEPELNPNKALLGRAASTIRDQAEDIHNLREALANLWVESNGTIQPSREQAHWDAALAVYTNTMKWDEGRYEYQKREDLLNAIDGRGTDITSLAPDVRHFLLAYERECAAKGIAPTEKDRAEVIEICQIQDDLDRERLSNYGLAWGPGHPMWDGRAKEERTDQEEEAPGNAAALSPQHSAPEDAQTKTDLLEASKHHDDYWHRVFADRIAAKPNRGNDIDR